MQIRITAIIFGLAALAFALTKPNFSGEWILNRQASTLSPSAAAIQSAFVRIEHSDPTFRYSARFVSANGPLEFAYELQSDGREAGFVQNGASTVSSLRWEGEALVNRSRIQRPDGETRISSRYELLDGGRKLRTTEQIRGGAQDQDNTWIFARR